MVNNTLKTAPDQLLALTRAEITTLAAGLLALAVGFLVLVGWNWDIDLLKRIAPSMVSMNPLTAIAFILASVSLLMQYRPAKHRTGGGDILLLQMARLAAALVLAIGLLRLGGYVFGWDSGVDQLFFRNSLAGDFLVLPNRMAPNTALGFLCYGLALLQLDRVSPRGRRPSEYYALIVGVTALVGLIGYAYGVKSLQGLPNLIPMALHTAAVFLILTVGILWARPDIGLMAVVSGPGIAGLFIRLLVPGMAVTLITFGWIRLQAEQLGYFSTEAGVALYTIGTIAIFALLLAICARMLERSEAKQKQIENERNRFFDQAIGLFAVIDYDGCFTQANQAFMQTLGYSPEEIQAHIALDFIHPDDVQAMAGKMGELIQGSGAVNFESRIRCRDGSWRRFLWRAVSYPDERRIYGAALDISEQREAEEALLSSEKLLATTLSSIGDAVLCTDLDGRVTLLNPVAQALTGWTHGDAIDRPVEEIFRILDETTREPGYLAVADALAKGTTYGITNHTLLIARDGRELPIANSCAPIRNEAGAIVGTVLVFRDVSEERSAAQKLQMVMREVRDGRDELHAVLDNISDGIISINAQGIVDTFNPAAEKLFGYVAHEVSGRNIKMLLPQPYQGGHDGFLRRYQETGKSSIIGVGAEVEGLRKDGSTFPLDLAIGEYTIEGNTRYTGILRDITERNQLIASLTKAREEAEMANRAKSDFLASMSHEIRTPMNGVIGMVDVLHQTSLQGFQVQMVELIQESAASLLSIVDDILDIAKIESGKLEIIKEPFNLVTMAESVCIMLDRHAEKNSVRLTIFTDPELPNKLLGDGNRLRQVLVNLLDNAIKFSSQLGRPGKVSLRIQVLSSIKDQLTVELRVADNGIGMDDATLQKIFDPFVQAEATTSRHYGGTGLGLSICRHLIAMMAGTLSVQSVPGKGSCFTVRLQLPALSVPPASLSSSVVSGLHCLVVGNPQSLAPDMAAYLEHDGASVVSRIDLVEARNWLVADRPSGLWILIIDTGEDHLTLEQLQPTVGSLPHLDGRFLVVLIERGKRRLPRQWEDGTVTVDGNVLTRQTFLRSVAIAAGRELISTVGAVERQQRSAAALEAPSREDALRNNRLILVVEDNKTNQKVILQQLALMAATADVANNGSEALIFWRQERYALVLTDLHMPTMDGYELTAAIRAEEQTGKRIPIIALTANALTGEKDQCLAAGMDGYLSKPAKLEEIRALLAKWLPPVKWQQSEEFAAAPATDSGADAPVDLRVLEELIGNDPTVLSELLQDFKKSAIEVAAQLQAAWQLGAIEQVGALGHKLKSSARTLGASTLGELCADIELSASTNQGAEMADLLARFNVALKEAIEYLDSVELRGSARPGRTVSSTDSRED
jgi:PAS domain S-box-containing protein